MSNIHIDPAKINRLRSMIESNHRDIMRAFDNAFPVSLRSIIHEELKTNPTKYNSTRPSRLSHAHVAKLPTHIVKRALLDPNFARYVHHKTNKNAHTLNHDKLRPLIKAYLTHDAQNQRVKKRKNSTNTTASKKRPRKNDNGPVISLPLTAEQMKNVPSLNNINLGELNNILDLNFSKL